MITLIRRNGLMTIGLLALLLSGCSLIESDDEQDTEVPADPPAPVDPPASSDPSAPADPPAWQWRDGDEEWLYQGGQEIPEIPAESWVYESDAITLNIEAAQQLNDFDGSPHTLVLRILQLNGRRDFSDSRETRPGIQSLLVADSIEAMGPAVVDFEELVIRPGESTTRVLDRYAETRYLAIVAGYFELKTDRATRLVPFPGIDDTEEVERGVLDAFTFGYFADDPEQKLRRPGRLEADLRLGKDGISVMHIEPR